MSGPVVDQSTPPSNVLSKAPTKIRLIHPKGSDNTQPMMRIQLVPYNVEGGDRKNAPCSIYLPLPTSGLVDNYQISFDPLAMGALGGVASTIYNTYKAGGAGAIDAAISAGQAVAIKAIRSLAEGIGDKIGKGDVFGAAVELGVGQALNPNYAILFQGIKPREFNFTWMLTAHNVEEARIINEIVYNLKYYSLPKKDGNGNTNFLLNYPAIAYIGLFGPMQEDQDKNKSIFMSFATGGTFITGLNINFNGTAPTPAFFKDFNSPVQVGLQLSFMERNILTQDDIYRTTF